MVSKKANGIDKVIDGYKKKTGASNQLAGFFLKVPLSFYQYHLII